MKAAVTCALLISLAAAPARAEDTVHTCIAASTDGQTLRKDGKLLRARAAMLSCARDVCPAVVRSHCARWLTEIEAQIPTVVVRAEDAAGNDVLRARVAIDGRPEPLDGHPVPLDPGEHLIALDAPDGAHVEDRVLVAEGETSRLITLRLPQSGHPPPTTTPPQSAQPVIEPPPPRHAAVDEPGARTIPAGASIVGGVGVAALAGSGAFALEAHHDLSTLDATCSPHCTESQTSAGRTSALLTDVLLGAGGVAVTGAVLWAVLLPSHAAPKRVGLAALTPLATLVPLPGGAFASLALPY